MMKTFLYGLIGFCLVGSAHALDFQCGKSIELLPVLNNGEAQKRPLLVVKTVERPDGTILKRYKPLTPTNEKVADFLMAVDHDIKVCIKYYDAALPAPVPLSVLDIYLDD